MAIEESRPKTPDKKLTVGVAALAAFLSHAEPVRGAEILPNTTWAEGVSEMHRGVVLDEKESLGWYVKGKRDQWFVPPTSGGEQYVL